MVPRRVIEMEMAMRVIDLLSPSRLPPPWMILLLAGFPIPSYHPGGRRTVRYNDLRNGE
jgi:hypothetical protein